MKTKATTHTATVENWNYGRPYRYTVKLRETANYWITAEGTKFRKKDGKPAGADSWCQTQLELNTINRD